MPAADCPADEAVAYIEALIEARHDEQLPDRRGDIAAFCERHGDNAVLIAERAFDPAHYDGFWRGTKILAGRFSEGGDDFFASVILTELGGA